MVNKIPRRISSDPRTKSTGFLESQGPVSLPDQPVPIDRSCASPFLQVLTQSNDRPSQTQYPPGHQQEATDYQSSNDDFSHFTLTQFVADSP
jgi:YtoQ family protein